MGYNKDSKYIAWCDCEMTGLDITKDELTEIAFIITDYDLNIVDAGFNIVIKPSKEGLSRLNKNAFVKKMHEDSGLYEELENGENIKKIDDKILKYLQLFEQTPNSIILAGNSIYNDMKFIEKQLPKTKNHLHYRLIDVSTIKELAKRWYPKIAQTVKDSKHRAINDAMDSINELRNYKENIFKKDAHSGFLSKIF